MKPPNRLSVIGNTDRVYVGKDTTVQDFIDWVNWFQAQNQDFNHYCSKFNGGK